MAAIIRARRLVIRTAFIAAVLGSVILSAGAQAAPGDLDPTFSGNGKQTTDFGGSSEAKAVVVQPDGKVVVVGATFRDFAPALARYKPNGTLDTSFSGDGKQTTDFGGGERGGASGGRQDRRGRQHRLHALRPRPLQPERHPRYELLRRRQADD